MIAWRAATERIEIGAVLDATARELASGARLTWDDAARWLVGCGRVEAGWLDHLWDGRDTWGEVQSVARDLSLAAARVFVDHVDGADTGPARRDLLRAIDRARPRAPRVAIEIGVPEGYAWYSLYPESYVAAARRVIDGVAPRCLVCGVRGIGTSLSAVVAAAIAPVVESVATATVRPGGHPFDRHVRLDAALRERIRGARAHLYMVVDEGPGLSGSSFAAAAEALAHLGAPPDAIVLLPSHEAAAEALRSERGRRAWVAHRRVAVGFDELWPRTRGLAAPGRVVADWSGGAWRHELEHVADAWPAVQPQHERRKYVVAGEGGGRTLHKFAGLPPFSDRAARRARTLADAGWSPPVTGCARGFLGTALARGRTGRTADLDATTCRTIGRYLAFVARTFPADGGVTSFDELARVVETNAREALGDGVRLPALERFRRAVDDAPACNVDGRLFPHEWLRCDARWLKTDGVEHHADHFYPGLTSIAWDLAGFEVEWDAPPGAVATCRAAMEHDGTRVADEALAFHRLAYLAFRTGYAHYAAEALAGTADGARQAALGARYRARLADEIARAVDTSSPRVPRSARHRQEPKLLIFDADGTLRRTTVPGQPCPHAPGEWELLPRVREVLARYAWGPGGVRLAVASNQDQVGYGLFTESVARDLLADMVRAAIGHVPDDALLLFCPHVIEERCACRKPEPGLLRRIVEQAGVAPGDALFVGDAEVDREAARRAGVPFRWAHDFFGESP